MTSSDCDRRTMLWLSPPEMVFDDTKSLMEQRGELKTAVSVILSLNPLLTLLLVLFTFVVVVVVVGRSTDEKSKRFRKEKKSC